MGVAKAFCGRGFLLVCYLEAIYKFTDIEKSRWEFEFCPLSGIKKRPLLGGCFSITTMLISIRNTELVRYREVVRFSEGPLSEARLYTPENHLLDKINSELLLKLLINIIILSISVITYHNCGKPR